MADCRSDCYKSQHPNGLLKRPNIEKKASLFKTKCLQQEIPTSYKDVDYFHTEIQAK